MTLGPKILIIDDDLNFVRVYLNILKEEGYSAESAGNRAEALARLEAGDWAIVLVDQRLRGAEGPDDGLDLLDEIARRAPGAKAIVITAYAESRAVERAFALGAFDYLEKTEVLDALLRVKLRSAWETVRTREAGALARDQLDAELHEVWRACLTETDVHRKGALLEDTMDTLFRTMPGFIVVDKRRSNDVEELDLFVRNESPDPFWSHEGPYLLVECKNWVTPVGRREFDIFRAKMKRRHQRCRLGVFVGIGGFTDPFLSVATIGTGEGQELVLPVDRARLDAWITSDDRGDFFKKLHATVTGAADAK